MIQGHCGKIQTREGSGEGARGEDSNRGSGKQIFAAGAELWWYQEAEQGRMSSRPLLRLLAAWRLEGRLEAGIRPVRENGSFPDPKD